MGMSREQALKIFKQLKGRSRELGRQCGFYIDAASLKRRCNKTPSPIEITVLVEKLKNGKYVARSWFMWQTHFGHSSGNWTDEHDTVEDAAVEAIQMNCDALNVVDICEDGAPIPAAWTV